MTFAGRKTYSSLSDVNLVRASNEFSVPLLNYLMWTQHWSVTALRSIDREVRNIIRESGGKHHLAQRLLCTCHGTTETVACDQLSRNANSPESRQQWNCIRSQTLPWRPFRCLNTKRLRKSTHLWILSHGHYVCRGNRVESFHPEM